MDTKKDTKHDKYLLTINNPLDKHFTHDKIKKIILTNFKTFTYCCMADEKGAKDHTLHTHVFVCFSSRVRFSMIKKYFPEAHIDNVKGTITDCVNYIKKEGRWENTDKADTKIDGTFEEWGKRPPDSKGRKQDMTELYQMIQDGLSNAEIIAQNQDYILQIDKLDKLRTMLLIEKYRGTRRLDLEVTYICGVTGSGKTRSIYDEFGDENVYRVTDYVHPFDGYNHCESVIVFDEFRSSLKLKDMLHYLDIYPIELPSRYANKYACYTKIFIVSNWCLEKQYEELQRYDKESWDAFLRRIHKVKIFTGDKVITYNSVEEYLNHYETFHELSEAEQQALPFEEKQKSPLGEI